MTYDKAAARQQRLEQQAQLGRGSPPAVQTKKSPELAPPKAGTQLPTSMNSKTPAPKGNAIAFS